MALGRFVSEIDEMPYHEFMQWQAYYALEPFGQERDNFHAGVIASTVANCHSKKAWSAKDFMLKDTKETKEAKAKQLLTGLRAFAKPKK